MQHTHILVSSANTDLLQAMNPTVVSDCCKHLPSYHDTFHIQSPVIYLTNMVSNFFQKQNQCQSDIRQRSSKHHTGKHYFLVHSMT